MNTEENVRSKTMKLIDEEWRRFLDVAKGFSEDELLLPNAMGHWSGKDLLGHVATWDQEAVSIMEQSRTTGKRPTYEPIDEWNNTAVDRKRHLTMEQTWQDLLESHQRRVEYVEGLPATLFGQGHLTEQRMLNETSAHYREHREDLERWQAPRS